ncbi:MAG: hypothetical protein LWW98_12070, partial [Deltaproteobacteria bacterium]|nr:hypothetical protein [Deltaproteobacteria bacterium]
MRTKFYFLGRNVFVLSVTFMFLCFGSVATASLFSDNFGVDTTVDYTVTDTWIKGGTGDFLYDAAGQRVQVITGNDVGLKFARDLPPLDTGTFSIDLLSTQIYPRGGILFLRLMQDQTNYYELKNTDGYGPKEVRKVVNGIVVDSAPFLNEYTQNINYQITINFSPNQTTFEAFGEVIVLNTDSTIITVSSFEAEARQQDAYYDNILYCDILVNQPPTAIDDAAVTDEESPVTINVIANDTDSDGTVDPTTVNVVTGPT